MSLEMFDKEIFDLTNKELERQCEGLEMIASENFTLPEVMEVMGSILTNKYAEGYPGKRYYGGCEFVDEIETLAIERCKKLFNCKFANVQPNSGSQANQGVYAALINPGDKILGMDLSHGGHLTHGAKVSSSGKMYESCFYGVELDGRIDYEKVREIAKKEKPKLIVCGASAYARVIDFAKFREIADEVGAYLFADIAHIAGLVVAGEHPSPFPHAHVVSSTTHKTLRGPRGGIIMTNDEELAKKINSAIFPGIQGGPLMHVIAAKAVGFKFNLSDEWKVYAKQVRTNAQVLANVLMDRKFKLVSDGTDNHLVLMSFLDREFSGKDADLALGNAGITANKNTVPGEIRSPFITSGLRLGTPALTARGFKEKEMEIV
ncbi:serine hydroxymethyltransferase, partial [Salmonella enterica subsp. enterica serovar Typhi]|nr:serine hydroxymethyltransferase [Salmonella enterica subsp. enterica serovar Typhi]